MSSNGSKRSKHHHHHHHSDKIVYECREKKAYDTGEKDSLDGNIPSNTRSETPAPRQAKNYLKGPKAKHKKHRRLRSESEQAQTTKDDGLANHLSDNIVREKTFPWTYMWVSSSAMYGKAIVLLMLTLCLTEVMDNHVRPLQFQSFFLLFLYIGSILAIMCIYISVVVESCPTLTQSRRRIDDKDLESGTLTSFGTLRRAHISRSKLSRTSFYLRIGALVFGLGTLIYNGLEIAMHATHSEKCVDDIVFAHPILQALFTFLQMHFLFVNSEVVVEKFGQLARFGFMHLVGTNVALWLRLVIWESAQDWIRFFSKRGDDALPLSNVYSEVYSLGLIMPSYPGVRTNPFGETPFYKEDIVGVDIPSESKIIEKCNMTHITISAKHVEQMESLYSCYQNNTLGMIWMHSMEYLFPFLIQYSLVAAAVTYTMWRDVGREKLERSKKLPPSRDTLDRTKKRAYLSVNCQSSSKGLLLGLLSLVGGIIVLIIFHVLKHRPENRLQLAWICSGAYIGLLTVAILVTLAGFIQIPKLSFSGTAPSVLDTVLSTTTQTGVFLFALFSMVAGMVRLTDPAHLALFVQNLLLLAQATTQGMFLSEITRRVCWTRQQMEAKPARQIVTFLLFANITLWGLDSFLTHSWLAQDMQIQFYGFLPWGIIARLSLPLMVLYRFHSAVTLVEVWKNVYKSD